MDTKIDQEIAIQQDKSFIKLSLSRQELREIGENITKLRHLESLNISYNRLKILPPSFAKLQKLTYLDLGNNQFRDFPEIIFLLPNLKSLNLRYNRLQSLPEGIAQLKNLESLNLRGNNLQDLPPDLAQLPNLKEINLHGNHSIDLESLADVLAQLRQPFQLNLSFCNIQKLPTNFTKLDKLQKLKLADNTELELKDTFDKIAPLKSLRELNVFNTQRHLPQNISELQQLTKLTFHRFKVEEAYVHKLSNLIYLEASQNRLECLPPWIFKLSKLESLILNGNKIRHIPAEINQLQYLKYLDVSYNAIESLPKNIAPLLARLNQFHLEGNRDVDHRRVNRFLKELLNLGDEPTLKTYASALFLGDLQGIVEKADLKDIISLLNLKTPHVLKYVLAALEEMIACNPLHHLRAEDVLFFAGSSKRYKILEVRKSLRALGIKTTTRFNTQVSQVIIGQKPGKKLEILQETLLPMATDKQLQDYLQTQLQVSPFSKSEVEKLRSLLSGADMANMILACQIILGRSLHKSLREDILTLYFFTSNKTLKKLTQQIIHKFFATALQALIEQVETANPEQKINAILEAAPQNGLNQVAFVNKVFQRSGNGQKQIIELGGEQFEKVIKAQMNYSNILSLRFNLKNISTQIEDLDYIKKIEIIGSSQDKTALFQIPETIYNLHQLEYLRIDETNLEDVSERIGNLSNLYKLRLADSHIEELPSSIGNLKKLKILSVFNNYLKTLPESLGELTELRELWAFSNQITHLPSNIGKLKKLRHLHLSTNYIQELPKEIGNLKELEELSLSGNPIEFIPKEIVQLKNLRRLEFGRKNRLDQATKSFLTKELPQCRITFYK